MSELVSAKEKDLAALELLKARNGRMHSAASIAKSREFKPRASDVFVSTYPKCGTTLVTAIVHALRAPELQDFGEITEVAPWDVVAHDCGQDLDAEQVAEPRLYKSHERWDTIAEGARYVYVIRHPSDAFASFYNFLPKYMHVDGALTIETFAVGIFGGLSHSGGIWSHFVGWIDAARAHPDRVLVVAFEDLKKDQRGEIARIAGFLFPDAPWRNVDRAHHLTTFEYMAAHKSQFDDHFVFDRLKAQIGLDAPHRASKVNKGTVGGRKDLPPSVVDMLDQRWRDSVQATLGCDSYDSLLDLVRTLNDQHHPIPPPPPAS